MITIEDAELGLSFACAPTCAPAATEDKEEVETTATDGGDDDKEVFVVDVLVCGVAVVNVELDVLVVITIGDAVGTTKMALDSAALLICAATPAATLPGATCAAEVAATEDAEAEVSKVCACEVKAFVTVTGAGPSAVTVVVLVIVYVTSSRSADGMCTTCVDVIIC